MSHLPPSAETPMRSPGRLESFFARSMTLSLAAIGEAAGIDALEWRVRPLQGEVVLQGSPRKGSRPPADLCARWATALGLDEFSYDSVDGVATWSRYESPWLIEVSSGILDGDTV